MEFWSAQEYVDELVFQKFTDDIGLLCVLDNSFVTAKGKGLILLTTG